ncbi:MAG: hypothetical protein JWN98_250 [Abditibacteriota bacterium]|nr:hypothetical protein [Abditibacteriota bacterium]
MTIGDVLAVVFFVIGLWISTWALLVGMALLFPARAASGQSVLAHHPWRALLTGALAVATVGLVAIVLINQLNGMGKLLGWAGLAALLGIAALGASGLSLLLGERVAQQRPESSRWSTLVRGAALLVVSGIVPLLGWFVILPLSIVASLGAGCLAIGKRSGRTTSALPTEEATSPTLKEHSGGQMWPLQSTLTAPTSFPAQAALTPAPVKGHLASSEAVNREALR